MTCDNTIWHIDHLYEQCLAGCVMCYGVIPARHRRQIAQISQRLKSHGEVCAGLAGAGVGGTALEQGGDSLVHSWDSVKWGRLPVQSPSLSHATPAPLLHISAAGKQPRLAPTEDDGALLLPPGHPDLSSQPRLSHHCPPHLSSSSLHEETPLGQEY